MTSKNGLINDQASNSSTNKNISDLSNLKGIDKKILDLILDNIYTPNTKIGFDDISGLVAAKQALREIGKWQQDRPDFWHSLTFQFL